MSTTKRAMTTHARSRRGVTALGVAAIAVCLGACGSTAKAAAPLNAPASTTSPPTTATAATAKSVFLAKGNAYCQTMNSQLNAMPDPGTDNAKAATESDRAGVITSTTLRDLRGLAQPPGDGPTLSAIYQKVDGLIADDQHLAAALRSGNNSAIQAEFTRINTDAAAANTVSTAYGLTVCGAP